MSWVCPARSREQEAIREAVEDFVAWTFSWQRRVGYVWGFDAKHPGVNSPKINPDYEWLHRRTWL